MAFFLAPRNAINRLNKLPAQLARSVASNANAKPVSSHQKLEEVDEHPRAHLATLDNGFRVVTENWGTPTCTVGVFMDIGSRYESDDTAGVSHFLEHVAFRGTSKRSQKDIETQAEERGAYLRSFTSREMAAVYAKCQQKDLPWAIELLSEVVKNNKYDDAVVEREKKVILQEMQELEGDLRSVVFDYLHATAYQGTPLGRPIIGQHETVQNLNAAHLSQFVKDHYKAPRLVLSAAGNVNHSEVTDLAKKHFSDVSVGYEGSAIPVRQPCRYTGSEIRDRDDAYPLAHVTMAVEGPGWSHPDTIALSVATALHGKWDLQMGGSNMVASQLATGGYNTHFLHSLEFFFTCYHDTSLFGIYFTGPREELGRVNEHMNREWMRMCTSVTDFEVQRAKNTLKTSLLCQYADGGMAHAAEEMGRQVLTYGRRMPLDELFTRIDQVDAETFRETCYKYIYDRCPVVASFGPVEGVTDYVRLRSNMYWLRH